MNSNISSNLVTIHDGYSKNNNLSQSLPFGVLIFSNYQQMFVRTFYNQKLYPCYGSLSGRHLILKCGVNFGFSAVVLILALENRITTVWVNCYLLSRDSNHNFHEQNLTKSPTMRQQPEAQKWPMSRRVKNVIFYQFLKFVFQSLNPKPK